MVANVLVLEDLMGYNTCFSPNTNLFYLGQVHYGIEEGQNRFMGITPSFSFKRRRKKSYKDIKRSLNKTILN
jgi:hypothetical protein